MKRADRAQVRRSPWPLLVRLSQGVGLSIAIAACPPSADTSEHDAAAPAMNDAGARSSPKCNATPTQLLTTSDLQQDAIGLSAAVDLAVSTSDLYVAANYGESGALLRVPIRGGKPTLIAAISGAEQALLVSGDSVVFAQSHGTVSTGISGEIVRIDMPSGSRNVLATDKIPMATIFGPSGILASDGDRVYFAAADGTKSVPLAGGTVQTLTTHTGSLTIVGSNLVIADSAAGGIFSVPLGGGDATSLTMGLSGDLGPVLGCGTSICWGSTIEAAPSQQGSGELVTLAPDHAPIMLVGGAAYRIVLDGSDFFATTLGDVSFGSLEMIPSDGSAPVEMGFYSGLAIDDQCLYVAGATQGVYSVVRSYRGFVR